ncbi:urease subunit gamma [Nonomuraea sp. NEAU-A123]|uniref:urease subunit gamma n=1 Tax=Nonomuraea sp. NEAU-A123 TaxID=2839649 RepID=UPI001BE45BFC|nr:urease subunit gamma [Nonomuraea sp. NEAU-A123]MBT2234328.1 urease subunit gamma [Nonomuraea sp. NEAU-A123]
MHLTPAEQDRLTVFTAAELARRRRSRGQPLSAPEVVALITDEVLEAAWSGTSMAGAITAGQEAVAAHDALPGVRALVRHVEVEALFPTGTALVVIEDPLGAPDGDSPGAVMVATPLITLNADRPCIELPVTNSAEVTVRVSSHYPFWEVNQALRFDRAAATGFRLDVPAGSNVEFPPGETRHVRLVALGGKASAPRLLLEEST